MPKSKPKGTSLLDALVEIIRKTSCDLPKDISAAIERGHQAEPDGSRGKYAMQIILENIKMAREKSQPVCQDTGTILFFIKYPGGFDAEKLAGVATKAVREATKRGYLRQNSVDSLTGRNSGTNVGPGSPVLHLEPWRKNYFDIRLVLKGGGSENMSTQYSLPDTRLGAGRDLDGVCKCVLDATHKAQGRGCGPGVLGVCVGGDRGTGYMHAKEQLLRKLDDRNINPDLARIESECLRLGNRLGIGPMGFGGSTTLLGVKIGALNRLPASFFVSIAYMCWAERRQGARVEKNGRIKKWFY